MITNIYKPYTVQEFVRALSLYDEPGYDGVKGETIARDMLSGVVEIEHDELEALAAHKNVTVEYLTEYDPSFKRYSDPAFETRKTIAAKLLKSGAEVEFAAEICGLTVGKVRELKME